jgi:uncharacterized membrane protein YfcA
VPFLALMHPALAPVPQTLVSIPLVMTMAWRERGSIDRSGIVWVLAGRVPGALLGLLLITVLDTEALAIAMAIIVLVAVVVVGWGVAIPRNPATSFVTGIASGTSALVASIGGPPLALLYRSGDGPTMRSSLAAVFAAGALITTTTRAVTGNVSHEEVAVAALLLPAVALGLVIGARIAPRVGRETLRTGVLVISALAAVGLIVKTLFG